MSKRRDTSVGINEERNDALISAAIELTMEKRYLVKGSDIVKYLIDNKLQEAVEEMKKEEK